MAKEANRETSRETMNVNLGCPVYCEGQTCVDLSPEDTRVVHSDAIDFLRNTDTGSVNSIYTKNMLEHMTSFDELFKESRLVLKEGGSLTVITDNAEFPFFYLPVIHRYGIGAHSSNKYIHNYKYKHCTYHYCLFTKLHLQNLFEKFGFKVVENRRITFGSRLKCKGQK